MQLMPGDISTNQTLSAPGSKNTKMKGFRTSVSGGNYPTNLFLQNIEKIMLIVLMIVKIHKVLLPIQEKKDQKLQTHNKIKEY